MSDPRPRIVIAALTYLRPEGLMALLHGIARIERLDTEGAEVVIVDNCPDGGARRAVTDAAATFPVPLTYLHCAERGLSAARNAALDHALAKGAACLGFIDDDEVPDPRWLGAHLDALRVADVSMGRVRAAYAEPPAAWIRRGGFLEFGGYARHQPLAFGATSNVMFRLAAIREQRLRFHPAFGLTGGEDTQFFDAAIRHGARIVFAPDAEVVEHIVPDRARLRWLWRRWRRTGQTSAAVRLLRRDGFAARGVCLAGGALRVVAGTALGLAAMPAAIAGRFDIAARGVRIAARGLGFIDGALGWRTEEYRVVTR